MNPGLLGETHTSLSRQFWNTPSVHPALLSQCWLPCVTTVVASAYDPNAATDWADWKCLAGPPPPLLHQDEWVGNYIRPPLLHLTHFTTTTTATAAVDFIVEGDAVATEPWLAELAFHTWTTALTDGSEKYSSELSCAVISLEQT